MDPALIFEEHRRLVVLPPELFRPIIQCLTEDPKALCAISLACRMLQEECERHLYRKMTFSRYIGPHVKFLRSILDNNRLALHVREYRQNGLARYQWEPLWTLLCRGLKAMVNLKVLEFRNYEGQPSAEILGGCTFQLQSLVWGNPDEENHLSHFLRSQQSLQKLDVEWAFSKRAFISPSFCPDLIALRGNRGTMETFLPGRNITSLQLAGSNGYRSRLKKRLSSCLSQIRFLAFRDDSFRPDINSIVTSFPSVEVLEFKLCLDLDDYQEMIPLLPQLKELRTLVISTAPSTSNSRGSPTPSHAGLQIFIHLFENCENLKDIHFSDGVENYRTYRWVSGSLDIQSPLTPHEEVHRWWHI